MKRTDLIQQIAAFAKQNGVEWGLLREGANHEVWSYGGQRIMIPRHRDINERTAQGILKDIEEA